MDAAELEKLLREIRALLTVLVGCEASRLARELGEPRERVTAMFNETIGEILRSRPTATSDTELQDLLARLFGGSDEGTVS
jgi:hypothetical protein